MHQLKLKIKSRFKFRFHFYQRFHSYPSNFQNSRPYMNICMASVNKSHDRCLCESIVTVVPKRKRVTATKNKKQIEKWVKNYWRRRRSTSHREWPTKNNRRKKRNRKSLDVFLMGITRYAYIVCVCIFDWMGTEKRGNNKSERVSIVCEHGNKSNKLMMKMTLANIHMLLSNFFLLVGWSLRTFLFFTF